ncbi:MAG TPA: HD domain-containing protein [Solirubrobacterales bacterium]
MSSTIADRLAESPAVRACREALGGTADAWIVGGAVRDAVLGRGVTDVDLAVARDEREAARAIAGAAQGAVFQLSEEHATWRALAPDRAWHVDVARLRGQGIEGDLELRDFTVNAIALPLGRLDGPPVDPHRGQDALDERVLRAVSERSFSDDPLRVLRAARIASVLALDIDPRTVELARSQARAAGEEAGERQLGELRLLLTGEDPVRGLGLLDELGATRHVLPELEALRGVEQNPYHHLDVRDHTIEVLARLAALEADLEELLGDDAGEVRRLLAEPLADELTRGGALRFAALFHDLGKPETRSEGEGGRILFIGHDRAGARIVRELCRRLRASRRLADYLANLTLNHLRLGFLVHERPLSRRHVYDYLRATDPDSVDVTLLTVADRLATQGERTKQEAIDAHLDLAREMVGEALAWRRDGPPRAPIRGDDLASELGIHPGPELGRLLEEIEAAVFAGEVSGRDDAVALARKLN